MIFFWTMDRNTKNTEDDAGHGAFVVVGAALSTICKSNEAIGYLLGLEFAWGNILAKVMCCSATKARGIHDGTVREAVHIADEVLHALEIWCIWVSSMARETVYIIHEIRAGILYNMDNFTNMCAEFSKVELL